MPTYSKQLLSGSSSGKQIEIAGTTSPGTTMHTVVATATSAREVVHLYAANSATDARLVTVEFGGTATADQIVVSIAAQDGANLIVPGWPLTGTDQIVRAFGTTTEGVRLGGFVNRIV